METVEDEDEVFARQARMDPEVVALCAAVNAVDGLETTCSCCGHGKRPLHIWFYLTKNIKALYPVVRAIDPRYGGNPAWQVLAEDQDVDAPGQPGSIGAVILVLSSGTQTGEPAYREAEAVAQRIQELLDLSTKYDFGIRRSQCAG